MHADVFYFCQINNKQYHFSEDQEQTQNSNPKLYRFSQILTSKSFVNSSTWKLSAHHDVNPSASPTMTTDMASNNREAQRWKIMERRNNRLSLSIYQSKPTTLICKCCNKIQIHKTKTPLDGFNGMLAYHSQLPYVSCFCFVKLIVIFYYYYYYGLEKWKWKWKWTKWW